MVSQINIDTVNSAVNNPDKSQPYESLGLKEEEYKKIKEILGRRPTDAELAMYSVMWSEHCSYKSSKIHLKKFGQKTSDIMKEKMLVGIGENAGVVDIGNGLAVTFKAESHNHPSFVEPFQGAATGVGGIVRDIIAMGARPIAVMDQLRFGNLEHADSHRLINGIVAGISHYGNCLGLPNIGGDTEYDESFQGNPLVNALCLGVLKKDQLHTSGASGEGYKIALFGARTGGDGIGGASILASESFDAEGEAKRPSVQVGDPFMEKVLIECCLELFENETVAGIQDLGAAGISCATSEMASGGDGGMHIDLEKVLLRDQTLNPGEILMSESQERMMAAVPPHKVDEFKATAKKWDVEYAFIGEVNNSNRLTIDCNGERIVDIDPRTAAVDSPIYERPYSEPEWQNELNNNNTYKNSIFDPFSKEYKTQNSHLNNNQLTQKVKDEILNMLKSPNIASKSFITDQYDRFVRGNTRFAQPNKSGVVRIDETTNLGVALATDSNSKYIKLNPYIGAQMSLLRAYLNVACTGSQPLAITDCLNFGNPEKPELMWQLVQSIEGLAQACYDLEVPVTGGNVSLYNTTGESESINPVVNIGMLGKIEDVHNAIPSYFVSQKANIYLVVPKNVEGFLDGSEYAKNIHNHFGGNLTKIDFDQIKSLAKTVIKGADESFLSSALQITNGGTVISLIKAALVNQIGLNVDLSQIAQNIGCFKELQSGIVVAIDDEKIEYNSQFISLCHKNNLECFGIGYTCSDDFVTINSDDFNIQLKFDELKKAYYAYI